MEPRRKILHDVPAVEVEVERSPPLASLPPKVTAQYLLLGWVTDVGVGGSGSGVGGSGDGDGADSGDGDGAGGSDGVGGRGLGASGGDGDDGVGVGGAVGCSGASEDTSSDDDGNDYHVSPIRVREEEVHDECEHMEEEEVHVVDEEVVDHMEQVAEVPEEVVGDAAVVQEVVEERAEGGTEERAEGATEEHAEGADEDTGCPSDPSLLKSYMAHIASDIWKNLGRAPLKCIGHGRKAQKVENFTWDDPKRAKFKNYIEASGLAPLIDCSLLEVNKVVLSAFVERWVPETNSFHMPVGEMTITLDDVSTILGLSVTGKTVQKPLLGNKEKEVPMAKLVMESLGVTAEGANELLGGRRGSSLLLEGLKKLFVSVSDSDPDEKVKCAARAYLMFILGCTLFADKSWTRAPAQYLILLTDLSSVHKYAWGAAALANLYRQLGVASMKGTRQLAGYLSLLEIWIYEHFKIIPGRGNVSYDPDKPVAYRWEKCRDMFGSTEARLAELRQKLDAISPNQVVWDPYTGIRDRHPRNDVAFYVGCIKSMEIVEPYHPDRVLRQFGMVQKIPQEPIEPEGGGRGDGIAYTIQYSYSTSFFERWQNHVLAHEFRGRPVIQGHPDCEEDYMDWYRRVSHLAIQNPKHRREPLVSPPEEAAPPPHDPNMNWELAAGAALTYSKPILDLGRPTRRGTLHDLQAMYDTIRNMSEALGWRPAPTVDEAGSSRGTQRNEAEPQSRRRRRT